MLFTCTGFQNCRTCNWKVWTWQQSCCYYRIFILRHPRPHFDGRNGSFKAHTLKKWSHFDLKSWVTGGTKKRPGIPGFIDIDSNIESQFNLLSIFSQFDSNILQLLGIPGRILVLPVTQLLGQNDSLLFFRCSAACDILRAWLEVWWHCRHAGPIIFCVPRASFRGITLALSSK